MSRRSRTKLLYNGCYAHVISRSIRKAVVFGDRGDFELFLGLLRKVKKEGGFKLHHYCLMQTHFHLLVQVKDVRAFSRAMNQLKSGYIIAYHTKYRISGPVWRERYKSLLIEDERYMLACGYYVEGNPVEAGLVNRAEEWGYSSAQHYAKVRTDDLIDEYAMRVGMGKLEEKEKAGIRFEKGACIGSKYFRFVVKERLKE